MLINLIFSIYLNDDSHFFCIFAATNSLLTLKADLYDKLCICESTAKG